MSKFIAFKKAVADRVAVLSKLYTTLYRVELDKDVLWNLYLDSFPKGTNELYKERREFDCNCCKQFVRNIGDMVAILPTDNALLSIWDIDVPYPFNVVTEALAKYVESCPVKDAYFTDVAKIGTDKNVQLLEDGTTKQWEHFFCEVPKKFVMGADSIPSKLGSIRDSRNVFLRSMKELTKDAGLTVLDLIEQGSLYRGEEHKANVEAFLEYKNTFDSLPVDQQDNWAWLQSINNPVSRIRNTALGTLLIDLSNGEELDKAVRSFEKIMAPTNYKRPTALITKGMIEKAEKTIEALGLQDSLARRFATPEDITINNILFGNRDVKKKLKKSVLDELKEEVAVNPKSFSKVEEVSIEDFVANILPNTKTLELMMENQHSGNLVSLVAPENKEAPCMLKWDNNFSWAYNGDMADSIKQNVAKAGGAVDGVLRFSIQWNDKGDNESDLDAHCVEPTGGRHIYFCDKHSHTGGNLDIDIRQPNGKVAVENITWPIKSKMLEGIYEFKVHNYHNANSQSGFSAEIEYEGEIHSYLYPKPLRQGEYVTVAVVKYSKAKGIEFIQQLESTTANKEIWGVKTNTFSEVSLMMYSPNYWDDQLGIGNKHYLFMLNGCKNPTSPRGFFNEYLDGKLTEHRKVFEVLGSKMRVEQSDNQLSGLGFSSTQRNSIIAKVTGSFTRTIKINF